MNSAAAPLTAMASGAPVAMLLGNGSRHIVRSGPPRFFGASRFQSVSRFAVGPVERKHNIQRGSTSSRAVQINPTAERVHSVLQP